MTDKPVLLEKLEETDCYRLYILDDFLERKLPEWEEEWFKVYILDDGLCRAWGIPNGRHRDYRYMSLNCESVTEAKQFARFVQRVLESFSEESKPEQEVATGLIDF